MNDASNPQNAYPAFWRRSRLSPKVQRNNFLLLSSPLTTAIGTWKKRRPDLWMSAFVAGAGISQLGHQGLPTLRVIGRLPVTWQCVARGGRASDKPRGRKPRAGMDRTVRRAGAMGI